MSVLRAVAICAALAASSLAVVLSAAPAHAAPVACSTSGTWRQGELNVYWFDVEQGDSQLIVGPTGKTLLIDLGENSWNSQGTNTKAYAVAQQIRTICGTGSTPVALDYVMVSHHHLDHIGYAHVPEDGSSTIGNGLYQLLTPTSLGGLGFTVGTLYDRDGGTWTDADSDSQCDVGTATAPAPEVTWHNVGTTSQTARRFVCWLNGPAGQADRAIIQGHVIRLTNSGAWPRLDLGGGATGTVVNANGKDTMQADGATPVSGDHSLGATPPSENDYSVATHNESVQNHICGHTNRVPRPAPSLDVGLFEPLPGRWSSCSGRSSLATRLSYGYVESPRPSRRHRDPRRRERLVVGHARGDDVAA